MTGTELTLLIQHYLQNDEATFVADIPTIIEHTETRIYGQVRTPDQRKEITDSVAAEALSFITPADFTEPLSLFILYGSSSYAPLLQKAVSFLRTAYPSSLPVFGEPKYYAIKTGTTAGVEIVFGPPPATELDYTLNYIGSPTGIISAGSTWLSVNQPDALLYGCLLEGYRYMKGVVSGEENMMTTYQARFDVAMNDLKVMCEGRNLVDEYRNPQLQVPAG